MTLSSKESSGFVVRRQPMKVMVLVTSLITPLKVACLLPYLPTATANSFLTPARSRLLPIYNELSYLLAF